MKIIKQSFLLLFLLGGSYSFSQVGINTDKPDTSSNLTVSPVNSNNEYKGTLLSAMTTTNVNSITNPSNGLLVYDLTLKCLKINKGTSTNPKWVCLKTTTI